MNRAMDQRLKTPATLLAATAFIGCAAQVDDDVFAQGTVSTYVTESSFGTTSLGLLSNGSSPGSTATGARSDGPQELGRVQWNRVEQAADFDNVLASAERPVLLLFQEIPG